MVNQKFYQLGTAPSECSIGRRFVRPAEGSGPQKKADRVVRPTVGQRGIADKRRRGPCAPPPFLCACHITAARALARAA